MDRRQFLTATTVTGTALLAGCGGSTDTAGDGTATGDGTPGGSTETAGGGTTGSFRLLISDRPADIGDFDSLDVTFDRARVHRQQPATDESAAGTEAGTKTADDVETATTERDDDRRGFTVFDLEEPTVDLTQVVGEKAIGVLEGDLETGQYSKVELYVSDVVGIVDGDTVQVTVPSGKLQITKPFEITTDGTVEFVFDINVVRRGQGGYNLLPVISESGVAGEDVDVEEVDAAGEGSATTESGTETATDA